MSDDWEFFLARWRSAGLLDVQTTESIRAWEAKNGDEGARNRFAVIAFGLGGLLLVAGILLFVASNWQRLSPIWRFLLLTTSVAGFHAAGAFASSVKPALATTLHAAGTGALGGAIFLSGQTFHLAENWPEGFLLWAMGAAAGFFLLRDWPHVLFTAVLAPLWLWSKVIMLAGLEKNGAVVRIAASFTVLLAVAYLFASVPRERSTWRTTLSRLGALTIFPAAIALGASNFPYPQPGGSPASGSFALISWALALSLPLVLAYLLRRKDAVFMGPAVIWVLAAAQLDPGRDLQFLGLLALYAAGSVGIMLWGLRDRRPLAVNVGVAGFALSTLVFYFATELFSKLGRSVGLMVAGLLFIGGGWLLERTRRTMIGKIEGEAS